MLMKSIYSSIHTEHITVSKVQTIPLTTLKCLLASAGHSLQFSDRTTNQQVLPIASEAIPSTSEIAHIS